MKRFFALLSDLIPFVRPRSGQREFETWAQQEVEGAREMKQKSRVEHENWLSELLTKRGW